ncbi:MAG: helix-turn-helix transcriptional regulator [Acidobacteria bacterium]|nr:helix-turn-helix transcriptional regulator [Acidobacteriota bacterium]
MENKVNLKPIYLAEKLLRIRQIMGLSQNEILARMGLSESLTRSRISEYEAGFGPPLLVLLRYARLANVTVDVLLDDELELPTQLPSPQRSDGIRRTPIKSPIKSAGKKIKQ